MSLRDVSPFGLSQTGNYLRGLLGRDRDDRRFAAALVPPAAWPAHLPPLYAYTVIYHVPALHPGAWVAPRGWYLRQDAYLGAWLLEVPVLATHAWSAVFVSRRLVMALLPWVKPTWAHGATLSHDPHPGLAA